MSVYEDWVEETDGPRPDHCSCFFDEDESTEVPQEPESTTVQETAAQETTQTLVADYGTAPDTGDQGDRCISICFLLIIILLLVLMKSNDERKK